MTTYKISGQTSHDADVHIIQNDTYFGKKAVSAGNYEVTIDSTVASGVMAIAKKSNGHVESYGEVDAITSSGTADLTAIGGTPIDTIQLVTLTVANGQGSDTVTINEVDMGRTILYHNGQKGSNGVNGELMVVFTNSTTITATRFGSYTGDAIIKLTVLEFGTGVVNSVQRGTITMSSPQLTNTASINEVDTSKCIVSYLRCNTNGIISCQTCNVELTNSTTVTANRGAVNGSTNVSFEVLEFV